MNCSKCGHADDLECPACSLAFCISCFVDHGKKCYEQSRKSEQKKCSVCGRYASINPVVHCSDCQIEICRSCLWAHKKTHEAKQKLYCVSCGDNLFGRYYTRCGTCDKPVCPKCDESHQNTHKTTCANCHKSVYRDITDVCQGCGQRICVSCMPEHKKKEHPKYRCFTCGISTSTECDECRQPYCPPCFARHRSIHEQSHSCIWCGSPAQDACPVCGVYCCGLHKGEHALKAHSPYSTPSGRINLDDFKINIEVNADWVDEMLKNTERQARENAERQAKATEERLRREQETKAKEKKEQPFKYCAGCNTVYPNAWHCEQCGYYYCEKCKWAHMMTCVSRNSYTYHDFGSRTWDEDESEVFKSHYRRPGGQQSQSNSNQSQQRTRTQAPSSELEKAFKLMGLSTRATVQEVKRTFRHMAKDEKCEYRHPDVGGDEKQFKQLNAAYEVALQHAQRNER